MDAYKHMFAGLVLVAAISWGASALLTSSDAREFLWPLPQDYLFSGTPVTVDSTDFQFIGEGAGGKSETLQAAFRRYKVYLFDQGESTMKGIIARLNVVVNSSSESLNQKINESYFLTITDSEAKVMAETIYGAMWGLETFSQLVTFENGQYYLPQCSISDQPRFKYRGFLIDTSRHYQPLKYLYQFLDTMAFNKFNVLHWHIVDGESFPYVSSTYPELSAKGAYSPKHIYSQKDVQNVISYAKERGIRVVPEFDTPGHSQSWGWSQPGLSTACYDNSTHQPNGNYGPIDPTNQSNWVFLEGLFKELSVVFPDQYIHLGGDEVSYSCWSTNPAIWKWMAEHNITGQYNQLEQYYATRLLDLVGGLKKSYIVWQEIFDNGLKVNPDTVVEVWKGNPDSRAAVTKAGLQAIYSACWYLNIIQYGPDWLAYYACDPQDFDGTPEQKKLLIGGEACMWSEFVDGTNLIQRSWPRGSAVGERLWSPQDVTNTTDADIRLHNQRCRMVRRGYPAQPYSGPSFCPHEWAMQAKNEL